MLMRILLYITIYYYLFSYSLRFFCPPPSLYLVGKGWESRRKDNEKKKSEGVQTSSSGPDVFNKPCCFVGIGNHDQDMQHLSLEDKVRRIWCTDMFCVCGLTDANKFLKWLNSTLTFNLLKNTLMIYLASCLYSFHFSIFHILFTTFCLHSRTSELLAKFL